MPRLSVKAINAAVKAAGIDAELYLRPGYSQTFHFFGPAVDAAYSTSVLVARLDQLTLEQWVAEAKRLTVEAGNAVLEAATEGSY